jgi:hypothetical protein
MDFDQIRGRTESAAVARNRARYLQYLQGEEPHSAVTVEDILLQPVSTAAVRRSRPLVGRVPDLHDHSKASRARRAQWASKSQLVLLVLLKKWHEAFRGTFIESKVTVSLEWFSEPIRLDSESLDSGELSPSLKLDQAVVRLLCFLLTHGAEPDFVDSDGLCPLFVLILYEDSADLIRTLVEKQASLDVSWEHRSLIDFALQVGNISALEVLVELGVSC